MVLAFKAGRIGVVTQSRAGARPTEATEQARQWLNPRRAMEEKPESWDLKPEGL